MLGREVFGGADDAAGRGQVALGEDLGDAEIGELDEAGGVAEDVGRLEVAVDDAVIVSVLEGRADLQGDIQHLPPGQVILFLQDIFEAGPIDIFHRVEVKAVFQAGLEEADNVRMVELAERSISRWKRCRKPDS